MEGLESRVLLAASPILVDTFGDVVDPNDGYTSLREAVAQAASEAGDDVVFLPSGGYSLNGQLTVDDVSGGLSLVGIDGLATLDVQGAGRVLQILAGSNVQLANLGITGGDAGDDYGGGIYNEGTLRLAGCDVYGNVAGSRGGGIYTAGGVLELVDSAVRENLLQEGDEYGWGVGICAYGGSLNLSGVTLWNNRGAQAEGLFADSCTVNIVDSTVSGHGAYSGIGVSSSTLNLVNAVVSGNNRGLYLDSGSAGRLTNATIAGNTLEGVVVSDGCTLEMYNTIVARNASEIQVSGEWTGSNNLIGGDPLFVRDPSAGDDGEWGTEDDDSGDLHLQSSSPAIQAGDNALATYPDGSPIATDRDGNNRVYGGTVDIGAYELQGEYMSGRGDIYGEVWIDLDGDGVRVTGEEGLDDVVVELYRDDGDGLFEPYDDTWLDATLTCDGGYYAFEEYQAPEGYFLHVVAPSGYVFSPQGQDSDVDAPTGVSNLLFLYPLDSLTCRAGLIPLPQPEIDVMYDECGERHAVNFGGAVVGQARTFYLQIVNTGNTSLEISDVVGAGEPFAWQLCASSGAMDWNIEPLGWRELELTFQPTEAGLYSGAMSIFSNDGDESPYEILLTGWAFHTGALPQGEGYYEVWGGNIDYRDDDEMWWQNYHNIDQTGEYAFLGGSTTAFDATYFAGQYDYYVIAARARVQVDAVMGSDGQWGYSSGDGNSFGWENLQGPPDGQYATIGYQGNSDSFCGFTIIQNPGDWTGLTVFTGAISLPLHVNIEQSILTDGGEEVFWYEHGVTVLDQGWSTAVRFQAPSGAWYDLWRDDKGEWEYWNESFVGLAEMTAQFGIGWYTIEALGGPFGPTTAHVWFGDDDGSPLAWPTQTPQITSIAPGQQDVPTTATLQWSPVTDPNVTAIHADLDSAGDAQILGFWTEQRETTEFGPVELASATNYEWELEFQNHRSGISEEGYGCHVARSLETTVLFRTQGQPSGVQPNLVMGEAFYTPGVYRPGDAVPMDFLLGNLGEGNALAVGADGRTDLFRHEVRLSFDTRWGNADDVVIYRRGDYGWLGGDAFDTRGDTTPKENWPGGLPRIPLNVERGNYYVLVGFDVLNQVAESNEADNLWVSALPDLSIETLVGVAQAKHVLAVGVANTAVKFRGDASALRVHQAFAGMTGLVTNRLVRYDVRQAGNQDHLLNVLAWFRSRVLPGDQFILYVAAQACHDLTGGEVAVEAQYNTAKGKWNLTRATTGDEYLYLSAVDGLSNWMSDNKLAAAFFDSVWAAADKVFLLDTPYAGGFIGRENPANLSRWDLSLLRYDPAEVPDGGIRTRLAAGSLQVIAAADEGQFAFMTPEKSVGWAGVNRMGTHMVSAIRAQRNQPLFNAAVLFWQTNEPNSLFLGADGVVRHFSDGFPGGGGGGGLGTAGAGYSAALWGSLAAGGTNLDRAVLDAAGGAVHVQLGAEVKAVRYFDADGSLVTITLSGDGIASLTLAGVNLQQTFADGRVTVQAEGGVLLASVLLLDTTNRSILSVAVRGGDHAAELGEMVGEGSLARLLAGQVDLIGAGIHLTGQGVIGLVRLRDVRNGADVAMSGAGPTAGVRFFAAAIGTGTDIRLAGAVHTLSVSKWQSGMLRATYLRSLLVKGDLGADLVLTGTNARGQSLLSAVISGNVRGAAWNLFGGLYSLQIRGSLLESVLRVGSIRSLRVLGGVEDSEVYSAGPVGTVYPSSLPVYPLV